MVNSAVLEVVIGMVFCFASVALIASYLYETGASLLGLRATSLLKGIKAMLNDPKLEGVALSIYNSALANPRHDGRTSAGQQPKVLPSYIASKDFASALLEHLQSIPEVLEAHATTGPGDLHCRIVARTNAHLQHVLGRVLEVPGIMRTTTQIALSEQVRHRVMPLVAQVIDDAEEPTPRRRPRKRT